MARILADLPDSDIQWLDRIAAEQGRSRAAVIRDAVQAYRTADEVQGIEQYFGIWTDREGQA